MIEYMLSNQNGALSHGRLLLSQLYKKNGDQTPCFIFKVHFDGSYI